MAITVPSAALQSQSAGSLSPQLHQTKFFCFQQTVQESAVSFFRRLMQEKWGWHPETVELEKEK